MEWRTNITTKARHRHSHYLIHQLRRKCSRGSPSRALSGDSQVARKSQTGSRGQGLPIVYSRCQDRAKAPTGVTLRELCTSGTSPGSNYMSRVLPVDSHHRNVPRIVLKLQKGRRLLFEWSFGQVVELPLAESQDQEAAQEDDFCWHRHGNSCQNNAGYYISQKSELEHQLQVVLPERGFQRGGADLQLPKQQLFLQLLLHLLPFSSDLHIEITQRTLLPLRRYGIRAVALDFNQHILRSFLAPFRGQGLFFLPLILSWLALTPQLPVTALSEKNFFCVLAVFLRLVFFVGGVFVLEFIESELACPGQLHQVSSEFPLHPGDEFFGDGCGFGEALFPLNFLGSESLEVVFRFGGPALDGLYLFRHYSSFSLIGFSLKMTHSGYLLQFYNSLLQFMSFLFFLLEFSSQRVELLDQFLGMGLAGCLLEVVLRPLAVEQKLLVLDLQLLQLVLGLQQLLLPSPQGPLHLQHVRLVASALQPEPFHFLLQLQPFLGLHCQHLLLLQLEPLGFCFELSQGRLGKGQLLLQLLLLGQLLLGQNESALELFIAVLEVRVGVPELQSYRTLVVLELLGLGQLHLEGLHFLPQRLGLPLGQFEFVPQFPEGTHDQIVGLQVGIGLP